MTVVYRLGGSLLSRSDLPDRMRALVRRSPDQQPLFVVGGGAAADIVRSWDREHHLGDETAHRLALEAMRLNEGLLAALLPEARRIATRAEAHAAWASAAWPVLRADTFLDTEENRLQRSGDMTFSHALPHTWDVTSDSLAAWIAARWPADALVLIKSIACPDESDPSVWGEVGAVDRQFSNLIPSLSRLGWVNLRETTPEVCWCANRPRMRRFPQTTPGGPT